MKYLLIPFLAGLCSVASAQVIYEDSVSASFDTGTSSGANSPGSFTFSTTQGGSDAWLVFVFANEGSGGGADVTGVTWDVGGTGQTFQEGPATIEGASSSEIWYLNAPTVGSNLTLEFTYTGNAFSAPELGAYGLYHISNTDGSSPKAETTPVASGSSATSDFTGVTAGSLGIQVVAMNDNNILDSFSASSGSTTTEFDLNGGGGATLASAYTTGLASGAQSLTVTSSQDNRYAQSAVVFAPVPEPSTAALAGLSALLFLTASRRRRS